jgi:hypothetical protein
VNVVFEKSTQKDNYSLLESYFLRVDDMGIFGRNLELFFPLLVTAFMIDTEVFKNIIDVISKLNTNKKEDEFTESNDVTLIEFVSKADRYRFNYVQTRTLFNEFKEYIGLYGNNDDEKWLNITWFGLALKRLKLYSERKREAKGVLILLNVDKAKEKLKIFKTVEKEEVKDVN